MILKAYSLEKQRICLALLSGLLLTGSFPNADAHWLAWFALVPLLMSLQNLSSLAACFRIGFIAGLAHYLTLTYWLAYTMKTYGHLPLYLCVPVLFLLSAYLALYFGIFAAGLIRICKRPLSGMVMIPVMWVALEYVRSFFLSGFPWGLTGYSQFERLHLIQISDMFGVYGVSFLLALSNGVIFFAWLHWSGRDWGEHPVSGRLARGAVLALFMILAGTWLYGKWQMDSMDARAAVSPSAKVAIVQGNIDQAKKWKRAFRRATTRKYVSLSLQAKAQKPDLVVWPETATPFYFLHNIRMTEMVLSGVRNTGAYFLIGSPSFVWENEQRIYHNSAYLVRPGGLVSDKYDKVHLVPFGEYIPFKKWLPFLGKMVEHVGDFRPGKAGNTLKMENNSLGMLICYEIIFPSLSRAMTRNGAGLLVNITNDAWYGRTSAPWQHFSMSVFRAVENKRSLVRSANTGISGFIDPVGRIMESTQLYEDAVLTRAMPIVRETTLYTQYGDWFAMLCLLIVLAALLKRIITR